MEYMTANSRDHFGTYMQPLLDSYQRVLNDVPKFGTAETISKINDSYYKDLRQWTDDYSVKFASQQSNNKVRTWVKGSESYSFRHCLPPWNNRPNFEELMHVYHQEKPGQARCADCGHCYLWRTDPKAWEIASWQVAHPLDAQHDLDPKFFKCSKKTYRDS